MQKNKLKCLFGFHDFKNIYVTELDDWYAPPLLIESKCNQCNFETTHEEYLDDFFDKHPHL